MRKPDFYLSEDEETGEKKPAGWGFLTDDGWRRLQGSDGEDDDEEEEGSDFAEERALRRYLLLASTLHGVPWSMRQLTATMTKKKTTTRKTSATSLTLKMMTSAWISRDIGVINFTVTAYDTVFVRRDADDDEDDEDEEGEDWDELEKKAESDDKKSVMLMTSHLMPPL